MTPKTKIQLALGANIFLLSLIVLLMLTFATDSPYFRMGPHNDLILVSVNINTYSKYYGLLIVIAIIEISAVLIEDLGLPILTFNIYNPDKHIITDFTKNELQIYGNLMFLINNLRYIFQIMVTITQIDIAVFSVLTAQLTGIITIRYLLNEKQYKPYNRVLNNIISTNNLEDDYNETSLIDDNMTNMNNMNSYNINDQLLEN